MGKRKSAAAEPEIAAAEPAVPAAEPPAKRRGKKTQQEAAAEVEIIAEEPAAKRRAKKAQQEPTPEAAPEAGAGLPVLDEHNIIRKMKGLTKEQQDILIQRLSNKPAAELSAKGPSTPATKSKAKSSRNESPRKALSFNGGTPCSTTGAEDGGSGSHAIHNTL